MDYLVNINEWTSYLNSLAKKTPVYAPYENNKNIDFQVVQDDSGNIIYNSPKTLTPLKSIFFPLRENVTEEQSQKKIILIGAKNCDIEALKLLDKVFLDPDYEDNYYKSKRDNTLLIGTDCFSYDKECHCVTCDIDPYVESNCDLVINKFNDNILITDISEKGSAFIEKMGKDISVQKAGKGAVQKSKNKNKDIKKALKAQTKKVIDYKKSSAVVKKAVYKKEKVWREYASTCVSCGACVTSCPTCHCFLLIDVPGKKFQKIRTQDACQYPGFERVAGGADPLKKHYKRFMHRYMTKYMNRPDRFDVTSCVGCGRCISTCIGRIDKNEVIRALAK